MNVDPGRAGSVRGWVDTWVIPAVVWIVGVLVFFRDAVFSGFDTVTGDLGDARLLTFLHEHWWQVLHGERPWDSPPMFHPAGDVLSYSDTFILDLPVYVGSRSLGVDPFAAYQLSLIAMTGVGFWSVLTILRRHAGVATPPACCLALAVAFGNNLYVDTGHGQMFASGVVPLVLLMAIEAWQAPTAVRGVAFGAATGVLLGLLLWSTFYLGWFALVIGAMAAVVAATLQVAAGEGGRLWRAGVSRWRQVCAAALGFGLAMVPFLATYLPALRESRQRTYDEVAGFAPRPLDLVNVGGNNVVWGWLLRLAVGADDPRLVNLNRAVALTPVLLTASTACGVALLLRWRSGQRVPLVVAGITSSITCVVVLLIPIQFGWGGMWAWLHRFVPGGDAIRVYGRIEVVNGLLACLAIGCWLGARQRSVENETTLPVRRRSAVVVAVLLGLIVVEQLNTTTAFRRLDRGDQLAWLDSVGGPPAECDTFHIEPLPGSNPDHAAIDAILIAQRFGLPTINGYSGWSPEGWNVRTDSPGYQAEIESWLERHRLVADCTFVAATGDWAQP